VPAVETTRPPRFDVLDPAMLADPYPAYARLRAAGPLGRGGPGQWVVARYDDVNALLREPRLTKNLPEIYYQVSVGGDPALAEFLASMNLGRRNRLASRLLAKSFSPGLVRELGPRMVSLVDGFLAPGLDGVELDVVTGLALPFPLMVICELLGIPPAERDEVWPRVAELVGAFSDVAFAENKDVTAASDALHWLRAYLEELLRQRPPGLLTRLHEAEEDGERLTPQEIVDNAITVFYAGFETSMGLVANGVVALLDHQPELARLRSDHSLVPAAVEEILRFEAPIQVTMRAALEPIEVAGRTVRAGRVLMLLLGSANRDPSRFDDPDRLDVTRTPNPHLSFGSGIYHCLGTVLARAEGAVVFSRLLSRTKDFGLTGDPVRRPRFNFRTFDRVPITLHPA
jgi:cytochrome P450